MKNRSKYGYLSAWLVVVQAAVAVLVFCGCNKRPYTRIKQLPVEIRLNWDGVDQADRNRIPDMLTLFLYQDDGTLRAQYSVSKEGLLRNQKVLLDVGSYKAICVNVDPAVVEVQGSSKYETTRLVAKPLSATALAGMFGKADDAGTNTNEIVYQPGWVFSGFVTDSAFKVGAPSVTVITDTTELSIITIPMARRIKTVNFNFTVTGVSDEIKTVNAALGGIASQLDLTTGKIYCGCQATSPIQLKYDAQSGTLTGTMLIFGNEAESDEDLRNKLQFQFETESGRKIVQEEDITEQLKTGTAEGLIRVEGNVDVRYSAGLTTIVITWGDGSSENVEGV